MATTLKSVDVAAIGLGAAGGVAVLPLARAGLKIAGIEAGTWMDPHRDFQADEIYDNVRRLATSSAKAQLECPTIRADPSQTVSARPHPMMNANRQMNCRTTAAILLLWSSALTATAQWIHYPTPKTPRTRDGKPNLTAPAPRGRDGKPDLSGIWDPDYSVPHIPPGVVIPSSLGPDTSLQYWRANAAPIPMTPWAESIFKERDQSFGMRRPAAHCLPHGIPDAMLVSNFKIVQDPGLTLILYEEFARFRQIFTDGRNFPQEMNPAWFGYSVGKWERDTLVVESAGFNDRSWLDDAGHPHSEQLRTIERFHRRDFGHLEVEININDPKAYTEPWSFTLYFRLLPDTELIENVCDDEKDRDHLVGRVASDEKKTSVEVPAAILSEYIGTYELGPATFNVSLSGGRLVLAGAELTAISQTEFSSSYGNVKFRKDSMILSWATGGEDELVRKK